MLVCTDISHGCGASPWLGNDFHCAMAFLAAEQGDCFCLPCSTSCENEAECRTLSEPRRLGLMSVSSRESISSSGITAVRVKCTCSGKDLSWIDLVFGPDTVQGIVNCRDNAEEPLWTV